MPEITFNGPGGRLEGRYAPVAGATRLALVLHPHPLYGGTMNNKVVYHTYMTFARSGFSTLRFNFRGVGCSRGRFDNGQGELADAAAAMDWLQQMNPDARQCWVAGFSFGAWIAMHVLMRRPEVVRFVAIAPPAGKFDFGFLSPCPASGIIIQGDADEIVSEQDVCQLFRRLSGQSGNTVLYRRVAGAGHFFDNRMDDLTGAIKAYIARETAGEGGQEAGQDGGQDDGQDDGAGNGEQLPREEPPRRGTRGSRNSA